MAEELHDVIEMEPSSEGDYSMPAPTGQASSPDVDAQEEKPGFDEQLPEGVDRSMVEKYAATCAEHFEQPLSEFKQKIVENNQMADFLSAFQGWAAKQPKPEATPDPWAEFRNEFINLRQAGFSTWVFKNKDRIAEAPQNIQEEAKGKWEKSLSGESVAPGPGARR